MSTLCLSDMGELHDEWLREPQPPSPAKAEGHVPESPAPRPPVALLPDDQAVAA